MAAHHTIWDSASESQLGSRLAPVNRLKRRRCYCCAACKNYMLRLRTRAAGLGAAVSFHWAEESAVASVLADITFTPEGS